MYSPSQGESISMVLLDILSAQDDLNLVIAHLDHGIRSDSHKDSDLVNAVANKNGLTYVTKKVTLGKNASEAKAREARYKFLYDVMNEYNADAIVTAHHENDMMETAVFNMLRGTGRRGLTSLNSTDLIKRPLLKVSKAKLYSYAKDNGLEWREDKTNSDTKYKRNYIRHNLLAKFNEQDNKQFSDTLGKLADINKSLDEELAKFVDDNTDTENRLNRHAFNMLNHKIAVEVMATWLRGNGIRDYDFKRLDILTISAKTLRPGQKVDVNAAYILNISKSDLALKVREC